MTDTRKPFIFHGGNFIEGVALRNRIDAEISGYDYIIEMGSVSLSLETTDLNALFHVIAKRLYDDNTMTLDTAEHVGYLCHVVSQDPQEALEAAMMEAGEDF